MKKILIFTIILIFISLQLIAQKAQDTLYLKNGSVVYGKILENSENVFRILTPDGFLFSFSPQEVERYIAALPVKKVIFKRTRGLNFIMESGLLIGGDEEAFFMLFSFTPMLSYTFNPIHSLSVGSGLELFDELTVPLFLEYKINFSDRNVTPYIYTKAGILINLESDYAYADSHTDNENGWTYGIGLGFSWPMSKFESFIQFGYRYALTKYTVYNMSYPSHTYRSNFNRLEMTWGFKF
jgi:hypothetical protein